MYLHDNLRNCLLALASRYPYHVIDINDAVLGQQTFVSWNRTTNEIIECLGWTADEIIDLFERYVPHLLQIRADLIIEQDRSVIHLPEFSAELPAFWLHCRGKLPPHRGETFRSFAHG
jgi:hypothetical protein